MTTTAPTPTPTPVETFEDILAVMEQNPRLRQAMRYHVLDEQYRELPAVVAQLATNIKSLTEVVQTLIVRQDRLEAAMTELATTVAAIARRQEVLDRRVNTMHGDVGRLTGKDYEGTVNKGIATRMRQHLNLRRPRIIHDTGNAAASQALNDILDETLDDETITPDEALEILASDFVVTGTHDGHTVYALGETSRTIRSHDITRAHERTGLLAKATDASTYAFAVGPDEPAPEHRELADRLGVTIIIAPEPEAVLPDSE